MKNTEIGMIPDDWEVKELGELGSFKGGGTPNTQIKEYWDGDIPWISSSDILKNDIHTLKPSRFITKEAIKNSATQLCPQNSILIVSRVGVGKLAITRNEVCTSQDFSNLICNDNNPEYIAYLLSEIMQKKANETQGTSIKGITTNEVKEIKIPVPPTLAEQQKIAKALSDVDNVISTLEKLITKKKNLKQGTMQQLLTGKKRLPGFCPAVVALRQAQEPQLETPATKQTELGEIPADWEVKTFGECCVKITDGSHFSPIEIENGFYMPSVKDMTATGFSFSDCKTISYNDYKKLVKMGCQPEIGDVLIAKDGSILKYAFSVKEKQDIVILSSIAILKPKSELLHPDFLAHYVSYPKFIEYAINNFKTGTGVPRIVLKGFAKLVILLPSKPEQTAIANVLSSMDKEIEALNTKLEKYRNLKTGMMQQLLTGKIRLV